MTNPWIFWLEVAIVFVLLYFLVLIVDSIYAAGTGESKLWWRQDVWDNFEYPDECYNCNRGDCVGCPVLEKEEK